MIVIAVSTGVAIGYLSTPRAESVVPQRQTFFAGISCQEVHELLPTMMRNEVDAAIAAQVREHLILCPECRRLMEQMKSTGSLGATRHEFPGGASAISLALSALPEPEL